MRFRRVLAPSAALALAASACLADVHELSGAELRASVAAGHSRSLSSIIEMVGRRIDGELVDARAYDVGGIYYRILLKTPDGKLVSAIIDARSGAFMSGRSSVARELTQALRSESGWSPFGNQGRGNAFGRDNGRGNGNGNAGGRGGNNRGGNSGGNGGGNGGGNSGGGGGGNSGGGGGNSGGGNGNGGGKK